MCVLKKSLYGHPEAGGHWERHFTEAALARGGVPVPGHPSTFWFPETKLLLTVYVDDLLLSGPEAAHAPFWESLRTGPKAVAIDDPEPLDRFLGRGHERVETPHGPGMAFAMQDYCEDALRMYTQVTGTTHFKTVVTPFVPEGSLLEADDAEKGELSDSACALLMKALWLGRLARPDIQKPIVDLSTHIQKWSRNDDKKLYRLMCYLACTKEYRLVGYVHDQPCDLRLQLFVDADFSGEVEDTKSTSGGWLVLAGPKSFFPLMWLSKRQSSTSRSTTEAEVISLAASLFGEGLPTLSLWDLVLGRDMALEIYEDNQATIKVVKKGYSRKLRHITRTHKIDLGSIKEAFENDNITISYVITTQQSADIFTKALAPLKWNSALELLNIVKTTKKVSPKVVVAP